MMGKGRSCEDGLAADSVTDCNAVVVGRLVSTGRVGVMAVPVAAGFDWSVGLQATLKIAMSKQQKNLIVFN